jgi:hypothetical protein
MAAREVGPLIEGPLCDPALMELSGILFPQVLGSLCPPNEVKTQR